MAIEKPQTGSFRGVNFVVQDVEVTFGRRNVLHEYPLRDVPYAEDLGRSARVYTFNACFVGPDYKQARDALIDAIENNDTPGTLVHPTLGIRKVIPRDCRIVYDNKIANFESLSLTFVDAGENESPTTSVDTVYLSKLGADSLITDSNSYFAGHFSTNGTSDFIYNSALSNVTKFLSQVNSLTRFAGATNDTTGKYSAFSSSLAKFQDDLPRLVYLPAELADRITALNTEFNDAFADNLSLALSIQKRLYTFGDDFLPVPVTTPLRAIEALNQDQVIILVKNSTLAEMIRILANTTYTSRQDAVNARDDVDALIQPQLITLADNFDDDIYDSLFDSRNAMITDIATRSQTLKDVKTVQIRGYMPALVLAYREYEDATQEADIVARNNIRNPTFVPPNTDLQILV